MVEHQMKLSEIPFRQIKEGVKTLEIRLYDEKRRLLELGDMITFSYNQERITMEINGLLRFKNFYELFTVFGGVSAGWSENDIPNKMVEDMRKYYSEEEENKFGVLGIHLKPIVL